MMTSVEVVRQMAAGKQVLLERESIHAMADIPCVGNIKRRNYFE